MLKIIRATSKNTYNLIHNKFSRLLNGTLKFEVYIDISPVFLFFVSEDALTKYRNHLVYKQRFTFYVVSNDSPFCCRFPLFFIFLFAYCTFITVSYYFLPVHFLHHKNRLALTSKHTVHKSEQIYSHNSQQQFTTTITMSNPSIMNNTSNVLPRINMTADFNRAVFVNNEGTRLVKQCQYDAAVKSFTTVLKILKPLAAIVENNAHQNSMRSIDVTGSESTTVTTSSSSSATSVPLTISFTNSNSNSSSTIMDSSSTNTNNPTTETAMAQIHLPPPSISPSPVRPYSSLSGEQQQQQQQKKEKKNISELEGAAVAQQQKLLGSSQLKSSITTSDKLSARKPSYFVFREPVEIPPGSVQRKKRKATSMMMSDNNNMDVDENENETLEDELLYYTPGLFSKFLMVTMYNLALTLHLHALSLSTPPSSKNDTTTANNSDNNNTNKIKKLFLRSRKLYELSFEMHLDESCDVNLLFTLALINNLGLVYYTLNENKRSQTCFKNMFSTMMYLMDTNESSTINEWDGLLSNVMDILFYNTKSDCSMYEVVAPAA